jgi:hypothetical protein
MSDILDQINGAGSDSPEPPAADEKPNFIEVEGVRYYREGTRQVLDPFKAGVKHEGYSRITINIAEFAEFIFIDGRKYWANHIYEIRDERLPTFLEIMARTWWHERATQGSNTNRMVGARNTQMNLQTQASFERLGVPGVSGN